TSEKLEENLAPAYERLGLSVGRLELMTGIRERRFFPRGAKPGPISAVAAQMALEAASIPRTEVKALIHGSVCRDQMEPATANLVHHRLGLPNDSLVLDVSNACLGLLNGACLIAQMIEAGQIRAGLVVGTEVGRPLVEGTIEALNRDQSLTRQSIKPAFASLTIGSGAAALLLCHRDLSQHGTHLLGGAYRCDTASHELCAGGADENARDGSLQMATDAEALLNAGIELAKVTWDETRQILGWNETKIAAAFTHQVGKAHRTRLLEELRLAPDCDYPVFDRLGNTGSAALPLSLALGVEQGHLAAGGNVALLGIGSGLNSLMLGLDWKTISVKGQVWEQ
ncbi:MAG: 3-oxoacyl-ACP synthase III, partial [Planctomycetaceae bacterium]|nr:3-oxoacyl-ACP synthase III [Planctomycetaceae bacterium]